MQEEGRDSTAARLATLAEEYVALVEAMRSGQYDGSEEWQTLSSQRTVVHDELIRMTGLTERSHMYGYCRTLLNSGDKTSTP